MFVFHIRDFLLRLIGIIVDLRFFIRLISILHVALNMLLVMLFVMLFVLILFVRFLTRLILLWFIFLLVHKVIFDR